MTDGKTNPDHALLGQAQDAEPAFAYLVQAFSIVNEVFDFPHSNLPFRAADYTRFMRKALELIITTDLISKDTSNIMCKSLMASAEVTRTGDAAILSWFSDQHLESLHDWHMSQSLAITLVPGSSHEETLAYMMSILANSQMTHELASAFDHLAEPVTIAPFNALECLGSFADLQQAADSLQTIVLFLVLGLIKPHQSAWLVGPSCETSRALLDAWLHSFQQLQLSGHLLHEANYNSVSKCLLMHHNTCCILNTCLPQADESAFLFESLRFQSIVEDLEDLMQPDGDQSHYLGTYAPMSLIPPAFLVATKCRDPAIRLRALNVLGALQVDDGAWNSTAAHIIAEMIMTIESVSLDPDVPADPLQPYPRLIKAESAHFYIDYEELRVTLTLRYADIALGAGQTATRHIDVNDEETLRTLTSPSWVGVSNASSHHSLLMRSPAA